MAPIPADKLAAIMLAANGDPDLLTHDENILPPSGELEPESVTNDSDTDVNDEATYFEKEVCCYKNIVTKFTWSKLKFISHILFVG